MNADTGEIYYTKEAIEAAKERGDPVVMVSDHVAKLVELGKVMQLRRKRRAEFIESIPVKTYDGE